MANPTENKKKTSIPGIYQPSHPIGSVVLMVAAGIIIYWLTVKSCDSPKQPGAVTNNIFNQPASGNPGTMSPASPSDKGGHHTQEPHPVSASRARDTISSLPVAPVAGQRDPGNPTSYDFALITLTNDKPDAPATAALGEWVRSFRSTPVFSTRTVALKSADFDKLADGETNFSKILPSIAVKYICLLRCTMDYTANPIYASLVNANGDYKLDPPARYPSGRRTKNLVMSRLNALIGSFFGQI